jgi:hypothetical protein
VSREANPLKCQAPGCARGLQQGMVLCTEHWNLLPRQYRDAIYAAKRKPEKYAGAHQMAATWLAANHPSKRGTE